MTNQLLRFAALATVGITGAAGAHHPPNMERCDSFAFSGAVERVDWHMPHVEITIRSQDGVSYRVSWLSINQLALVEIDRDTLQPGDEVTVVAGVRRDDVTQRPMLLSYIHRNSDGWGWSELPQGC